jgi:CDP-diacylglycerol--serine O-phosphatidyltransferase
MSNLKQNIPNALTLTNLLFGCLAILSISNRNLESASWLVIGAAVIDFLDGFAARLFKVNSDLGKQLDSLADVVTFGVVPGLMLFSLLSNSTFCQDGTCWKAVILPYYGLLIPLFSAYRLAKFNIDTRQTHSFIGVPTPANALMIACINLVPQQTIFNKIYHHHIFLTLVSVIMSYLLIAEIPLFSLKFKTYQFAENKLKYLFLVVSLALILLLKFASAPFILIMYITLSQINNYQEKIPN